MQNFDDMGEIAYIQSKKNGAQINDIVNHVSVTADNDTYTLDLANKPIRNFRIEIDDDAAKTVALDNMPQGDCEIFIELTCTQAPSVTWFDDIIWLTGSAPTFTQGEIYRIVFFRSGANWHGVAVGGW